MNDSSSGRRVVRLMTWHCVCVCLCACQATALKRRSMCWAVESTFRKTDSSGGGRRTEETRRSRCLAGEPGRRRELRQLKYLLDVSLTHVVRTVTPRNTQSNNYNDNIM